MSDNSTIEWTDATWNPVRGCSMISEGCTNCYAARQALRHAGPGGAYEGLAVMGKKLPLWTGEVRMVEHARELPLTWRKQRRVFVNSMSDLFHPLLSLEDIAPIFDVMCRAEQHQFQVLTKRSERLTGLAPMLPWPKNIWMGVSVELEKYYNRIEDLRSVPAAVRFLSLEPLLGPMNKLPLDGIHWVIVGGESGPSLDLRAMDPGWVREVRDQCVAAGVPFFFKQWGGRFKKKNGRLLDGVTWDQFPIP